MSLYGQIDFLITQKHHQTSFLGSIWPYTNLEGIWNFHPNPSGKNPQWLSVKFQNVPLWLNWLSYYLKHYKNTISRSNLTIHILRRNLKLWPKIIHWPLWKNPRWLPVKCQNVLIWLSQFPYHSTSWKIISSFIMAIHSSKFTASHIHLWLSKHCKQQTSFPV